MNFNEFFCLKYPYLFLLIPELYQYALLGALDQKSGDLFFLFFFPVWETCWILPWNSKTVDHYLSPLDVNNERLRLIVFIHLINILS